MELARELSHGKQMPNPSDELAALTAALRDLYGPAVVLESWSADPLTKRGRHHVVRYDVRARVPGKDRVQQHAWVGKFYERDDDARTVAGVLIQLSGVSAANRDTLIVPRVLAYQPAQRMLLQTFEAGESVLSAIPKHHGEVEAAIGRALATLHQSDVQTDATTPPAEVVRRLRRKVGELITQFPNWAPTLRHTLDTLEHQTPRNPATLRFLHGDLGAAQMRWHAGRIVLLDFDNCTRGDPAMDLGTMLAQLRRLALRKPDKIPDLSVARLNLLAAYEGAMPRDPGLAQRIAWYELAALLRKIHFLVFETTRHPDADAIEQRRAEALRLMGQLPSRALGGLSRLVALSEARAAQPAVERARDKPSISQRAARRDRRRRLRTFFAQQLGRIKWAFLFAVICTMGTALMDLVQPWPLKLILDHGLLEKPLPDSMWFLQPLLDLGGTQFLIITSLSLVVIAIVDSIFAYFQKYVTSAISYRTVYALRRELFVHLQQLPLSFHSSARSGDLLNRIQSDTDTLKDMVSDDLLKFCSQVLTVIGMFLILVFISWRLALITLGTMPFLSFSLFHLYRKSKISSKKQKQQDGKVAARMVEVLAAIPLVQAFGREKHEAERFDATAAVSLQESIRVARLSAAAARSSEIITAAGVAAAVLYGALQVQDAQMLPGVLILVVSYLNNFYKPLRGLAKLSTDFSKTMASADRLSEVLDIEPQIRDRADAVEAPQFKGDITFKDVCFAYGEGEDVLHDMSFRVRPGQRVALVGHSGSGKSTIGNLILRLYEPRRGTVLIDGEDIQRYSRESLRRQIGIVLQDAVLFGMSVRENIAYGNAAATEREIEAAAKDANADEFIRDLPKGYDTVIGERGSTLSGGQQQRIAIARALIRNAPILILDEPMTGLDVESEAKVREALDRLMAGRTCIMMTHDLEAIADADQVLFIEDGRLAAQGTHAELLESSDRYRELYELDRDRGLRVAESTT
jgi:ABC-type multidrug transport system fused ATPase/permease subunit/aminoglycoside phosphotransferase (APT) family kinase protein